MNPNNPHSRRAKDKRVFELSQARVVRLPSQSISRGNCRPLTDADAKMMVVRACR